MTRFSQLIWVLLIVITLYTTNSCSHKVIILKSAESVRSGIRHNSGNAVFNGDLRFFLIQKMKYPEEALEEKTEGNVLVRIQINMNGRVKVIKVLKGLSQECDKEAVRLMRLTSRKWTPASENGKSVTSTKTIVVQFNIRDFNQKTSMREGVRID